MTISIRVASSHIGDIIKKFKEIRPDVSIKVVQMNSKSDFAEDIGLCSSSVKINKKNSHTLFKEDIALAVPLEHPFVNLDKISLIELC